MTIAAPCDASVCAVAAPIPRPAPVRIATRPSKRPTLAASGRKVHFGLAGCHLLTLLIFGPDVDERGYANIRGLGPRFDDTATGQNVAKANRSAEADRQPSNPFRSSQSGQVLAQKAHTKHAVGDHAAK